jgi:hypothetical protein
MGRIAQCKRLMFLLCASWLALAPLKTAGDEQSGAATAQKQPPIPTTVLDSLGGSPSAKANL